MAQNQTIYWSGTPSHYECVTGYTIGLVLAPFTMGLSLLYCGYLYVLVNSTSYEVNEKSIIRKSGLFTRKTDELMLYRIQDISLEEPFWMRMVNLANLKIFSTDKSDPIFYLTSIKDGEKVRQQIRDLSEELKDKMKIRPFDR